MAASRSAAEAATGALRRLIAERAYHAGDRLPPERELTDELAVSRPTLREGIGRLVAEGVLEARRGSGTYVAEIDLDQIFDVRLLLEPFAAREAAHHRTPAQLEELRALLTEIEHTSHEPARFAAADAGIHAVVARAAGNPVLHDILDRLAGLTNLSRAVTSTDHAVRDSALTHLRGLVAAVAARDAGAAERAMRDHLRVVRRAV